MRFSNSISTITLLLAIAQVTAGNPLSAAEAGSPDVATAGQGFVTRLVPVKTMDARDLLKRLMAVGEPETPTWIAVDGQKSAHGASGRKTSSAARSAASTLLDVLPPGSRFLAEEETHSIIIYSSPTGADTAEQLLQTLDRRPNVVLVRLLHIVPAPSPSEGFKGIMIPHTGSVILKSNTRSGPKTWTAAIAFGDIDVKAVLRSNEGLVRIDAEPRAILIDGLPRTLSSFHSMPTSVLGSEPMTNSIQESQVLARLNRDGTITLWARMQAMGRPNERTKTIPTIVIPGIRVRNGETIAAWTEIHSRGQEDGSQNPNELFLLTTNLIDEHGQVIRGNDAIKAASAPHQ